LELRKFRTASTAATIHPAHWMIFARLTFSDCTLAFPRAELIQDLLQGAQHGDLALRVVELQAFHAGFQPVQGLCVLQVSCLISGMVLEGPHPGKIRH
jgi:hypothetical protein